MCTYYIKVFEIIVSCMSTLIQDKETEQILD